MPDIEKPTPDITKNEIKMTDLKQTNISGEKNKKTDIKEKIKQFLTKNKKYLPYVAGGATLLIVYLVSKNNSSGYDTEMGDFTEGVDTDNQQSYSDDMYGGISEQMNQLAGYVSSSMENVSENLESMQSQIDSIVTEPIYADPIITQSEAAELEPYIPGIVSENQISPEKEVVNSLVSPQKDYSPSEIITRPSITGKDTQLMRGVSYNQKEPTKEDGLFKRIVRNSIEKASPQDSAGKQILQTITQPLALTLVQNISRNLKNFRQRVTSKQRPSTTAKDFISPASAVTTLIGNTLGNIRRNLDKVERSRSSRTIRNEYHTPVPGKKSSQQIASSRSVGEDKKSNRLNKSTSKTRTSKNDELLRTRDKQNKNSTRQGILRV